MRLTNLSQIYAPLTEEDFWRDWNILQSGTHDNQWIAGYITYEAGYLFEERLRLQIPTQRHFPLFWLGVFESAQQSEEEFSFYQGDIRPQNFCLSVPFSEYERGFAKILETLHTGDSYQVNYTLPSSFRWSGTPWELYQYLLSKQRVAYSCFCDTGRDQILSVSPELFFEWNQHTQIIRCKPMKGTARRDPITEKDHRVLTELSTSEKNRAENLMITDLIRNDLGKLATPGTVHTQDLFQVESYDSVHQMTSTVTAKLRPDTRIWDLFRCLFPCGSVTGAPKLRSMEIIRQVETSARGVYTGSIGFIPPVSSPRSSVWNVAIRTATLHNMTQYLPSNMESQNPGCTEGEIRIGSGIVLDSEPHDEYEECRTKAEFLSEPMEFSQCFTIFESIFYNGRIFRLLNYHLDRMQSSAHYFGIPFSAEEFRNRLESWALHFHGESRRLRISLSEDGNFQMEDYPFQRARKIRSPKAIRNADSKSLNAGLSELFSEDPIRTEPNYLGIHPEPVSSRNLYLHHKTSHRRHFDRIYKNRGGCIDILFVNERGELTESCVHNVFIRLGGIYYTPPRQSGILPGTLRAYVLKRFPRLFQERVLYLEDLRSAERIVLGNSVRGFTECRMENHQPHTENGF